MGIVHQAPAFGEDDYNIGVEYGYVNEQVPPPDPLDESGRFTDKVPDFAGMDVKEADKQIIKHLRGSGRLVVESQLKHSYPMCYRSDTPLIYRAVPAWFIRIPPIVPQMLANIEKQHWVPSFVKERRFAAWIENAHDWNVSRNRYDNGSYEPFRFFLLTGLSTLDTGEPQFPSGRVKTGRRESVSAASRSCGSSAATRVISQTSIVTRSTT